MSQRKRLVLTSGALSGQAMANFFSERPIVITYKSLLSSFHASFDGGVATTDFPIHCATVLADVLQKRLDEADKEAAEGQNTRAG